MHIYYNLRVPKSEVILLGNKKMGRPTDNPKNGIIKIRADEETIKKLGECSEKLNLSRSDIIRKGINDVHNSLNKK